MTFNARFIANIIHFAAQQGVSKRALLALTGTDMDGLQDEQLRFDAVVYNAVMERALALSKDPCFGLHAGEYLSLSAAGIITQLVQTSRTVHEALGYVVEFANLGCSALPFTLSERPDAWELSLAPNPLWVEQSPASVRHTIDGVVVFTIREFQTLTRQRYYPLRLDFSYARPAQSTEYERLFRCPVYFNQEKNGIYLDKKQVAEPVVTSDYQLLQILVQHAEARLAAMQQDAGFFTIVKQSILNLVKPQFPTIEQVAANLNISVRTLQRKLQEEGHTYKSVLDELRRQLAADYLRKENLSIQEIAYLLDYADASAFSRSFKRWTGKSPGAYRQQIRY
ncbi:MAG TPA: AraC family transcriptional regulator [Saprospiraceae bacterium]|nr:AraC family transcriptional regulator [Saprospiraceae bacterium]HMP25154.1 AraC family transcriptional regulator [Saprospiraceae bacterium]